MRIAEIGEKLEHSIVHGVEHEIGDLVLGHEGNGTGGEILSHILCRAGQQGGNGASVEHFPRFLVGHGDVQRVKAGDDGFAQRKRRPVFIQGDDDTGRIHFFGAVIEQLRRYQVLRIMTEQRESGGEHAENRQNDRCDKACGTLFAERRLRKRVRILRYGADIHVGFPFLCEICREDDALGEIFA